MHSFIIEIVTVHHAGVYECVARNRAGESRFTMSVDVIGNKNMWSHPVLRLFSSHSIIMIIVDLVDLHQSCLYKIIYAPTQVHPQGGT